jgi:hypothetical protein
MKRQHKTAVKTLEQQQLESWQQVVQDMWVNGKTEDYIVDSMEVNFCDLPELEVRLFIQDLRDGKVK